LENGKCLDDGHDSAPLRLRGGGDTDPRGSRDTTGDLCGVIDFEDGTTAKRSRPSLGSPGNQALLAQS